MPTPFPGMDPYLEISGDWRDFHATFIATCPNTLNDLLPEHYVARIDERFRIMETPNDRGPSRCPDIAVEKTRPREAPGGAETGVAVLDLPPVMVRLAPTQREEVRETWIEIRKAPNWDLVTSIELLSPSNKEEPGFSDYLGKRADLIERPVHLVELDLLVRGRRPPMADPLPPGTISRSSRGPSSGRRAKTTRGRSAASCPRSRSRSPGPTPTCRSVSRKSSRWRTVGAAMSGRSTIDGP